MRFSGWVSMAFHQTFPNHVLILAQILIQTGKKEQVGAKQIQTISKICDSFSSLIIILKVCSNRD